MDNEEKNITVKNISYIYEKFKNHIGGISIYLYLLAFLYNFSYYKEFGFNILHFSDLSDILLNPVELVLNSWFVFLICYFISLVLINGISYLNKFFFEILFTAERKFYVGIFISIVSLILWVTLNLGKNKIELAYFYTFLLIFNTVMHYKAFPNKLKKAVIVLSFLLTMAIMLLGEARAKSILDGSYTSSFVKFKYEDIVLKSSDSLLYAGENRNYIFMYDKEHDNIMPFSKDKMSFLEYRNDKKYKFY